MSPRTLFELWMRAPDEPQTVMGRVNVMHELETPRFKQEESVIHAKIGTRFGLSVP